MQEIISCPSCQRKLQVPDSLVGQDVQCPTCGATFVAALGGGAPAPAPRPTYDRPAYDAPPPRPQPRERRYYDDDEYEEDYERGRPRRRRRDLLPHRGGTVLTFGILSLVICGIILGPIAWTMGNNDMNEIRAGRMDPEGEGLTQAGRIMGIIGTLLNVLGFVFLCLMIAASGGRGRF